MESTSEKNFYQDAEVLVTQARFVARDKTYAMRNISSVSIRHIKKSKAFQIMLIIIGALCLFGKDSWSYGIVILALGILLLVLIKDEYSVHINSNSGEADGFTSKDKKLIEKIVDAVNEAIIYRG